MKSGMTTPTEAHVNRGKCRRARGMNSQERVHTLKQILANLVIPAHLEVMQIHVYTLSFIPVSPADPLVQWIRAIRARWRTRMVKAHRYRVRDIHRRVHHKILLLLTVPVLQLRGILGARIGIQEGPVVVAAP